MIKSTANWIEINLNCDDKKTKSIQRRFIINDDNDEEFFTIWINYIDNNDFMIRRRFAANIDDVDFTKKIKKSKSFIINADSNHCFTKKNDDIEFNCKISFI